MTNLKQNFEIIVWYRFISAGEQEKEYDVHVIEAEDVQEAVNKASSLYTTFSKIPFGFYYKGEKYKTQNFTHSDLFHLTEPML